MYTLLSQVELPVSQHSQVLLHRAIFHPFSARLGFVLGIALISVQDLVLGHVGLREVWSGTPPKPLKVPLDDFLSFLHVNHTTQLGICFVIPKHDFVQEVQSQLMQHSRLLCRSAPFSLSAFL